MELLNTRKRFQKRIEFERKIITLVNSLPNLSEPLYGLSKPAIDHWQMKNEAVIENITPSIIALAKDLMAFCDSSKNAFDIDKRINSAELQLKIDAFKQILDRLH